MVTYSSVLGNYVWRRHPPDGLGVELKVHIKDRLYSSTAIRDTRKGGNVLVDERLNLGTRETSR